MSALEEVKSMQQQGMSEDQIVRTLQENGVPYRDISDALAQSKIKAAVEQPSEEFSPSNPEDALIQTTREAPIDQSESLPLPTDFQQEPPQQTPPQNPQAFQGMQQSMMKPTTQEIPAATPPMPPVTQEYTPTPPGQEAYDQQGDYGYQDYEEYSPYGVSSDTITEISEQIVAEKFSEIRKHLEKVSDFKTTVEAKTEALEERLKRLEKIIDTLQVSVLKKVGSYVTNTEDIKKELIATQKSFSKLVPSLKTHSRKTTKHKTTRKKKK